MNKIIQFEELNEIYKIFETLQNVEDGYFSYKISRNVDDYELWIDLKYEHGNLLIKDNVGITFGNPTEELDIEALVRETIEDINVFINNYT